MTSKRNIHFGERYVSAMFQLKASMLLMLDAMGEGLV